MGEYSLFKKLKGNISGVLISPMVPFDANDQVQVDILGEHLDFLINSGVNALACLGTMGEFPMMPIDMRKMVAEVMIKMVAKRVPVVIGVGSPGTSLSINLAKNAEESGADAVYCVPPFYYTHDEEAILSYYRRIASSIKIPLYVYNIPRTTRVNIKTRLMIKLANIHGIVGLKDSTGNLEQTQSVIKSTDLDVYLGSEILFLPGFLLGAAGCVSGAVGPVFPEVVIELWRNFTKGDLEGSIESQNKINALKRALTTPGSALIPTIKEGIRLRGHRMGSALKPFRPLNENEKNTLKKAIDKVKL